MDRVLPETLADALPGIARSARVHEKAIALAAFRQAVSEVLGLSKPVIGVVANGRSERLSDPLGGLGLFWSFAPFRSDLPATLSLPQLADLESDLLDIETHAISAPSLFFSEMKSASAFFTTFNYVNFHNSAVGDATLGFQTELVRSHDRFHFPLNMLFARSRRSAGAFVRIEFATDHFASETISRIQSSFEQCLLRWAQLEGGRT